jgi:hypothetical protein
MSALGITPIADIVTVKSSDDLWRALVVDRSQIIEQTEEWVDNKETALEELLDMLSYNLMLELTDQLV